MSPDTSKWTITGLRISRLCIEASAGSDNVFRILFLSDSFY